MAFLKLCNIVQGFREDCATLIERFEKLGSVRFEGFCEIWRDMKFQLVFLGRKSLIEQIEFCEDALLVAKEFFLPPLSFKERVGGLYLLYALYYKMPIEGPKIRVKLDDWSHIMEMQAEIVHAEHHDASYILSKLMLENAFVYCALDRELGLEKSYRFKVPRLRNAYTVLRDLRELTASDDLFNRINTLGKLYEMNKVAEMERSERPGGSGEDRSSLKLYDSNLGEKLEEGVRRLVNSRKFMKRDPPPRIANLPKNINRSRKQEMFDSDPIRNRFDHGFETVLSELENEQVSDIPTKRQKLPDVFDDSSDSE